MGTTNAETKARQELIAEMLTANPKTTPVQVSEALNITRNSANYHLNLVRKGLGIVPSFKKSTEKKVCELCGHKVSVYGYSRHMKAHERGEIKTKPKQPGFMEIMDAIIATYEEARRVSELEGMIEDLKSQINRQENIIAAKNNEIVLLNQKLKGQDEMERRLNVAMRGGVVRGD
jgi:hypothetical protein